MSDFKSRIRALEQRSASGDAEMLATLLRAILREGSTAAAIASLETERSRPLNLDPAFVRRAEQTAARIRARVVAIDAAGG